MAAFTLVAWRHLHYLQSWPLDGATCVSSKFDHQRAPFELVPNLTTRWRQLHWLQILPPDSPTCITCQFSHQLALLTLFVNFATRWHYLHWFEIWQPGWLDESHALPHCLGLPFWHYQLVLTWYLHQLESHQLSFKNVSEWVSEWQTSGHINRTPGTCVR